MRIGLFIFIALFINLTSFGQGLSDADKKQISEKSLSKLEEYSFLLESITSSNVPLDEIEDLIKNSYIKNNPSRIFYDHDSPIHDNIMNPKQIDYTNSHTYASTFLNNVNLFYKKTQENSIVISNEFVDKFTETLKDEKFLTVYYDIELNSKHNDKRKRYIKHQREVTFIAIKVLGNWNVYIKQILFPKNIVYPVNNPSKSINDSDSDGIPDNQDKCPNAFSHGRLDGCPDKDKDDVPDYLDDCPNQPGLTKFDGCPDKDGDGIPDNQDKCPDDSGHERYNGCPDSDNDGLPDDIDKCKYKYGKSEHGGCPDSDFDNIPDYLDKCPDTRGKREFNGCPFADQDGDGIPDKKDDCPNEYGLKNMSGCPDSDKDGIMNKIDKCPTEYGRKSNDGCPDRDGDGVIDKEDYCIDEKGSKRYNGCPRMLSSNSYARNSYLALNYPFRRGKLSGLFEPNIKDALSDSWSNFKSDIRPFNLSKFGLYFYAPLGFYIRGYENDNTLLPILFYSQDEIDNAHEILEMTGSDFTRLNFTDRRINGLRFDAGLTGCPFYKKKFFRHFFFTFGISYINGTTWEVWGGDISSVLPSSAFNEYAVATQNFGKDIDMSYGIAFVLPFFQASFDYDNRFKEYSISTGINIPFSIFRKRNNMRF